MKTLLIVSFVWLALGVGWHDFDMLMFTLVLLAGFYAGYAEGREKSKTTQ